VVSGSGGHSHSRVCLAYDKWDAESRDFLVGDAPEKSSGLGIKAAGGLQLTVAELPVWLGRLCDEEKCKVGTFIFPHRCPHSGHDAFGIESRPTEQDAGRINASRIISALLARHPEKEGVSA
jgi:hypothetical protein